MNSSLLASVERSPLFTATAAPYLLLDPNLIICSANVPYLGATGRSLDELVGEYIFAAFPDNPDDPGANGVQNLFNRSLESVLRTAQRSCMWVQRYDVRGPTTDEKFIVKYWSPINSPIRDDRGRVAGILHHAEDVTSVYARAARYDDGASAGGAVGSGSLIVTRTAAVALSRNEEAYARLVAEADQLREGFTSRVVIEQAKGIVMAERHCGPEEAFKILRKASNDSNVKLRDMATALVARVTQPPGTDGE